MVAASDQVLELAQHTKVATTIDSATNQVSASYEIVDLIDKSAREKRKDKQRLVKGLSTGGQTGSTKVGNNQFIAAEGEIVFTPEDNDKRRVLQTHMGLHSKTVLKCLISNILLPTDVEKMEGMTCCKLNQFVSDGEYKVRTGDLFFPLVFVEFLLFFSLYSLSSFK